MQVWNVLRAARRKIQHAKIAKKSPSEHHPTSLSGYIFATKACIGNRKKKLVKQQYISSTCPRNMVNFGPLAAEIVSLLWGTPANFNGFRVLAALLHGTPVVGVSQTLRRWTEGATCIRQGGHYIGHWPTFLVNSKMEWCTSVQHFTTNSMIIYYGCPMDRAGHYIFALWFLSFFYLFFRRLISAAADRMSTILPHMVWPLCEFRMQVWNVLHTVCWKYRTQKNRHFGTIAQLCRAISSELRHVSTIGKKLVKHQYLQHII